MITVRIDDSTKKGKALLDYIKTLDFVEVEKDEYQLSDDQLKIIEERREKYLSGESNSETWEIVKKKLNKK
jgi:hypothetical protein